MGISYKKSLLSSRESFTLVELLIVIGIVAGLSVAVVIVLSPVQLLKQARDATRLSDVDVLAKTISFYESDRQNAVLGTSTIVYVSLADPAATTTAGTDCAGLGLGSPGGGMTYHCAASSTLRRIDGTGWLPIDLSTASMGAPISRLPVDPTSVTSSGLYFTYVRSGNSFKLIAGLESDKYQSRTISDGGTSDIAYEKGTSLTLTSGVFPSGWVKIPGGGFVMKYEAKYDKDGDGQGDTATAANCIPSAGGGVDWRDSGCNDASKILSTAVGTPIVHITRAQAKAACESIGAHLIINSEWMAIARDVEQVASNWSAPTCLSRGNNGTVSSCSYNGSDSEGGINRNTLARLVLTNGLEIWDFSGNVWELVMRDALDVATPEIDNPDTALGGGSFQSREINALTSYGSLSYDMIGPSNVSLGLMGRGVGHIYTCDQCAGSTGRYFIRGGGWSSGSYGGAFALDLSGLSTDEGDYMGFRCAR